MFTPTLRNLFLIVGLLLALATSVTAKPDALPPPVIPDCLGVNIHFTGAPAQDLAGLARGGFRWVRMDFAWAGVEKQKGVYDFSAYDALVAGLTAQHIRPLFILDYGNDLYQQGAPRSPEARAAFVNFAVASVMHYQGKPILWEIWNEPNGSFWSPKADVGEYGRLALETARAIKQADPGATVMAPGSAGIPASFLESLFKMGLLRYVDAVSVHPYRGNAPETATSGYQDLRQMIAHYEPEGRDIPIVSSEWGYSTVNVSEQTQAQYIAREWLSNLAEGVRLSIWYDWHDDGPDPKNPEHNFGTVNHDYTQKPAFLAAQTLTHALNDFRFIKRIPLASEGDYLLLFAQGSRAVKLAAWTTGSDHTIALPIAGQPSALSLLGEKMTIKGNGKTTTLTLTGSPQYISVPPAANKALMRAAAWSAEAQNPFYSAQQPLHISLTYSNGDAITHRVQFVIALGSPAFPQPVRIINGEDIVAPGRTLHQGATYAKVSHVAMRARIALILDGVQQPYPQDVRFLPADPLSLSIAPAGTGGNLVTILNPAGTAFRGQLERITHSKTTAVPVRLASAQKSLDMAVVGRSDAAASWTLLDHSGIPVANLPLSRFVPYPINIKALHTYLDGDLKIASQVTVETPSEVQPLPDVVKIAYHFAPGWTFWQTGEAAPPTLLGKPAGFGLWIFGNAGGDRARVRFQDATGQTFQPNGEIVDWQGWRFVLFPLTPDSGHWGGSNDGIIHYPIHILSLFLLDSQGTDREHDGTITLGRPAIMYTGEP